MDELHASVNLSFSVTIEKIFRRNESQRSKTDGSNSNIKLVIQERVFCTSFRDYKELYSVMQIRVVIL